MIKMAGIVLIVLGILALVYQGFSYKETKQDAQIGSLTIQHKETETVPLPPIVGSVFIVAGVAALVIGGRRNT
jgi:heme/copper-type cytochrome/quinol oxidase subunit 2